MDPDQQLRNLRDFLLVYNRMTEICFQRCSSNFNYRNLTMDEERCVDNCAGKLIRSNHRLMGTYVQLMPRMVQRRMEEMESKAAAAAAAVGTAEASPAIQAPFTSSQPPQVTEVPQEVHGSVLMSAGLDTPADPTLTGVSLSAAMPLIPKTEGGNVPVVGEVAAAAAAAASYPAGFPKQPLPEAKVDSGSHKPAS